MARRARNGVGSVRRRSNGLYEVQFYVPDPLTGLMVRKSAYGRKQSEALEKMQDKLDRVAAGQPLTDAATTVGAFAAQWLDSTLKTLPMAENYRDQTRYLVRGYVIDGPIGNVRLDKLKPSSIDAFVVELQERTKPVLGPDREPLVDKKGTPVTKPALATSTIRSTFLALRKLLDTAVRDGLIASNPARKVQAPKIARKQVLALDDQQVVALLDELAKQPRMYVAAAFISDTALRRGEALALDLADLDLVGLSAMIDTTLSATKGGTRESDVKTEESFDRVSFSRVTAQLLTAWRAVQAAERLAAGPNWVDSGKVFTTSVGTPINPRNFLRAVQDAAKRAGLPAGVGVHTLRHSTITHWLESGVHTRAVRDMARHSSAQVTLDIYGHTADKVSSSAHESVTAAFGVRADVFTAPTEPPAATGTDGAQVIALRPRRK